MGCWQDCKFAKETSRLGLDLLILDRSYRYDVALGMNVAATGDFQRISRKLMICLTAFPSHSSSSYPGVSMIQPFTTSADLGLDFYNLSCLSLDGAAIY